jgi:hypothetical protein
MEDAAQVASALLARYAKSLEPEHLHALLSKADATRPLYLRMAVEELRQVADPEELTARLANLPDTTTGLFDWMLSGLEQSEDLGFNRELVSAYTGYIALSRGGMAENDVVALCAPIAPDDSLRILQRVLRPYLVFRGEAVDYCQVQLRRAVETRYLSSEERTRTMHRAIAEHFRGRVKPRLTDPSRAANPRAFADLPYHARQAQAHDIWQDSMTDFSYLQHVVEHVDVGPGLASDGSTITWHGGYFVIDDELDAWLREAPRQDVARRLIEPLDQAWDAHPEFVTSAGAVAATLYSDLMSRETEEPHEVMDRENRRFVMQGGPLWTWCERERQKYEDPANPWQADVPEAEHTSPRSETPRAEGGYDVFISYRREGGADTARLIRAELKVHDIRAFLDVDDLGASHFDISLLHEIECAPNFIVVLSEGSLLRCRNEGDWLRREIAHAIANDRNIVPVRTKGFSWPDADELPPEMRSLPRYNGVLYIHEYGEAAMDKLLSFLVRD